LKDQMAVVKDGVGLLSDAVLEEFALVRKEMKAG